MIQIKKVDLDGKIVAVKYSNDNFEKDIPVHSYLVKDGTSKELIGDVLEEYRKLKRDNEDYSVADNYFESKSDIVSRFLKTIKKPFNGFVPDAVHIFYPKDAKRNKVLSSFYKILSSDFPSDLLDFSGQFVKNVDQSVVGLSKEQASELFNFDYNEPIKPVKKLQIFDDTLDKGTTLSIFLDSLFEKGLIDEETEIRVVLIYNNGKSPTVKFNLNDFKEG